MCGPSSGVLISGERYARRDYSVGRMRGRRHCATLRARMCASGMSWTTTVSEPKSSWWRLASPLQYLSDDEYAALQQALADNPDAGDVIRGSGGVRKLRWGLAGRGKRGGIRVIYYLRSRQGEIWMLTLYAKNEVESIPGPVLKKIKEEIDGGA